MPSVEDSGSDCSNCVAEDAPLPPFLIGFRNVGGSNVGGSGVEAAEELESAAESAADFEDEVEAEEELTDEVEAASKGEEPFRREDVRRKLKESYM